MTKTKKRMLIIILSILLFMPFRSICYANAAEPPSILIIVSNPPSDLEISVKSGDTYIKADKVDKAMERYYTFYSRHLSGSGDYVFKITTGKDSYEITIEKPLEQYNNIYTLNLKSRTLTPGKLLSRSILLVSTRVILTLLIEAIIFWLFGFRSKNYWTAFLIINLITQGILNICINGLVPIQSYLILNLVAGEILVLIAEMYAFLSVIKAHRLRTILYVITANLMSLITGGYMITVLPI